MSIYSHLGTNAKNAFRDINTIKARHIVQLRLIYQNNPITVQGTQKAFA